MREEFPKSGENALNPEVSVEAGTELPKKKVDSNVSMTHRELAAPMSCGARRDLALESDQKAPVRPSWLTKIPNYLKSGG